MPVIPAGDNYIAETLKVDAYDILTFEEGARLIYTGADVAVKLENGNDPTWTVPYARIENPWIICTQPMAVGLDLSLGFQTNVINPIIFADIQIDIDDANTMFIIGGGVLTPREGVWQAPGTRGIRLAKSGWVNNLLISVNEISRNEVNVELGSNEFNAGCSGITFLQTYFAAAKVSVLIHGSVNLLAFYGGYSEGNIEAVFKCDHKSYDYRPRSFIVDNFRFTEEEKPPAHAIYFEDYYDAIDVRSILASYHVPFYFGPHTTGKMNIDGTLPFSNIVNEGNVVVYSGLKKAQHKHKLLTALGVGGLAIGGIAALSHKRH